MTMELLVILPEPSHAPAPKVQKQSDDIIKRENIKIPAYGSRKGWVPRSKEVVQINIFNEIKDFSDGGAFPEIFVPQYPQGFQPGGVETSNALIKTFDSQEDVRYDTLLTQGQDRNKIVHASSSNVSQNNIDISMSKPVDDGELVETTQATKEALEKIINKKISSSVAVRSVDRPDEDKFVRYTPSFGLSKSDSNVNQRIFKMVDAKKDPMMPSSYKINKKVPRGPPSPPVPILHSPPRKVSNKEAQEWRIPPCISNWKNPRGYTIPLHMRVAADGRGLQNVQINENFAKLTESLYIAENNARKAVEYRASIEKKKAQKEKERNEAKLRKLAEQAREELATMSTNENDDEVKERDEIRRERARNRQRDRNIRNAAPEKRSKLEKERDRDISEKIALGLPIVSNKTETMYDQRLFNQSSGINSGFVDEDAFNAYDKPWQAEKNAARSIYHPSKNIDDEVYGIDASKIANDKRFVPDKPFQGTNTGQRPDGPVQFEEDLFGIDQFLNEVKEGRKK
ncbi:MAG: SNW domain-containing protein 1 [Paramarteilia canceri]